MVTPRKMIGAQKSRVGQPFRVLGIEFAPLSLPMERRLQTLAAGNYLFLYCTSFLWFTCFLSYLLFYTEEWKWVPLLYTAWYFYDQDAPNQGGREWTPMRDWFLTLHFANYFPINLVRTTDLEPGQSYLFAYHPHGLLSFGAYASFATKALGFSEMFPGLTPSVDQGQCTVLVVGGVSEAIYHGTEPIELVLNRRKGFAKLAIQHGRPLVPVFGFGEHFLFDNINCKRGSWFRRFQLWCDRQFTMAPIVFRGRGFLQYTFGLIAKRKPIHVVVGKPLEVTQNLEPTREEVESLHAEYVRALLALYKEYNPIFGDPQVKLEIPE